MIELLLSPISPRILALILEVTIIEKLFKIADIHIQKS